MAHRLLNLRQAEHEASESADERIVGAAQNPCHILCMGTIPALRISGDLRRADPAPTIGPRKIAAS